MIQQPPGAPRQRLNLEQAFERAATLHHRNRLNEAEALYRAILDANPNHFGALHHLGLLAHQNGDPQQAERLLRRALAETTGATEARNHLGLALQALGRSEEALAQYQQVIAIDPRHVGARNNLGNVLHLLGRSEEAIAHFEFALTVRPDVAELHNNLGNAQRMANRLPEAIRSFGKALAIRQDFAEARNNLGVALAQTGRHHEAVAEYQQAIAIRPQYFEAHNNYANTLAALDRDEDAILQFEISLGIKPDDPRTRNNYGNLLVKLKRNAEAISQYRVAISEKPDFYEAYNNLGNALATTDPAEAIVHFQKALEINPGFADALSNLGNVLGGQERYEEAIICYKRALCVFPDMAEAHYCLGNALVTVGRIDEGRKALEAAIALAPGHPDFYRSLGECKRFTAGDPHLAGMEALAQNAGSLSDDQRIVLHFVLSKAYDDLGRHEDSFQHLREANGLRRAAVEYDEAATLGLHQRVIDVFTAELIRQKSGSGVPSCVPIFILGMPRSGTTLIEQVLASHPNVFGAGEILAFHNAVNNSGADGYLLSSSFPEAVAAMSAADVRHIGERYLRHVAALAPAAERITDKALGNFVFAGLIHLALPNARIIHARRDPVDTCLSCYSKLFASELLYTYDLGELGRYYRSYEALMAHWHEVLPDGAMLDVQYEELISDFESQTRRILSFCDLAWDDRCLSFHQTQRPVRTASATQVRQPIYRTSIGRSRPYETMLQPLIDALRR